MLVPVAILGGVAGGLLLILTGEKIIQGNGSISYPFRLRFIGSSGAIKKVYNKAIFLRFSRKLINFCQQLQFFLLLFMVDISVPGLGVITIAALGLFIEDNLIRLNALKQLLSLCVNVAAAIFFLFSGQVYWLVALVMAVCALLGGTIGGKLAGKFKPEILRWVIVSIGVVVAVIYFVK